MTVLICPPPDDEPWPTLGPDVCAFIESELCHGPGDLMGDPVRLSDEHRAWIYRMYEVEPPTVERRKGKVISRSANPRAGKRRFQRCALSLRKGSAKTELAAWIAGAELHPDGPVRCAGFESVRGVLQPIPRAVSDPYIPMISNTEEQTEELAYGALRRILEESPAGAAFDIGLERILRLDGNGKAEAVSATPNARDGARTTFQHADETHRFTLENLKKAWTVMLANLSKRPLADPWALETTTAPEPGVGSVAEQTMEYAQAVMDGKAANSRLFFYHRQASDSLKIDNEPQLREAIIEASGPYIAKWTDVDRIVGAFQEPGADREYLERVWLNRLVQSSGLAFDIHLWRSLVSDFVAPDGDAITLGFDGARFYDAVALVATHIVFGHQWPLGIWERPANAPPDWEIPVEEVDGAVSDAFERWNVARMYADPPLWDGWIATWASRYGKERVVEWRTYRRRQMAYELRSYVTAMEAREVSHDGNPVFAQHIANSRRQDTGLVDEDRKPLWILRKERPDSPKKIDGAMAGCLSWAARNDALAAGLAEPAPTYDILIL